VGWSPVEIKEACDGPSLTGKPIDAVEEPALEEDAEESS
jgi:hypothetical protein